jgi:predicted  nucleic acid-binding Zn-ribbon protein
MSEISNEDEAARKSIEALAARVSEAQSGAEGVLARIGQTSSELVQLKAQADKIRIYVDSAVQVATDRTKAIDTMLARAVEGIKQIEEDARKANSESGFAFNAKANAEEHAKAISQLRGAAEVEIAAVTANKNKAEELAQGMAVSSGAVATELKVIADGKATAVRDAAVVTAAAERVAAVMPSIDQGSKDANAITAAKDSAEATALALQTQLTQISEVSAKAVSDSASIATANEDIKKLLASMTDARTTAIEANERLRGYETDIKRVTGVFEEMHKKLEGLLPHATSVGLASAFHIQKARFSKPQPYWLSLFVVAIVALLLASSYGLPTSPENWDAIFRHFVNRLPLVAPLVWLAIYAGHHYNMALRMEEDYAFKEAVSTAFEGYKREMLAIPAAGSNASPLVILCENVLSALAERPGRIYDGRNEVITPLTPLATAIKDTVAGVVKPKTIPT